MKKLLFITLSITLLISFSPVKSGGDNKYLKIADTYYLNGEYFKAIKYYNRALKKGKIPTESYENLASSYLKTDNIKAAHKYYLKAEKRKNAHREIEVIHAFALKKVGEYKKSRALLKHYMKVTKDSSVLGYIQDCTLALKWRKPNPKVKVAKIDGLNSFYSDMAPYYSNGKIIFSSAREDLFILNKAGATGQPYYRLYSADINGTNATEVHHYHYHEKRNHNISSLCFGDSEDEVFYSTNQKIKKDTNLNISPLKIYHSIATDGKWDDGAQIISLENDHINYAHPFYDKKSKRLYFTSNMEGGIGGMDIYYVEKSGEGWSDPVNAGDGVNTKGNEAFPSFYNNTLYFSSDVRAGLGGYDVFASRTLNNNFQVAENLKMPINTNYDDFGFTFTDSTYTLGYFTSNRKGTRGGDDIFAFKIAPKDVRVILVSGIAIDAVTGDHLANTTVKLTDEEGSDLGSIDTDDEGHYKLELLENKKYALAGDAKGYFKVSEIVETTNKEVDSYDVDLVFEKQGDIIINGLVINDKTAEPIEGVTSIIVLNEEELTNTSSSKGEFNEELKNQKIARKLKFSVKFEKEGYLSRTLSFNNKANDKGEIEVVCKLHKLDVGTDIGKVMDVAPIYFDVAKSDIKEDAKMELDKIVEAMNTNPKIEIELGSHTDARGDDAYNLNLSDERAKSSMDYIVSKGIAKNRISSKGYGESQLVNECTNGVECTDDQHKENRRTEFKITKF